MRSVSSYVSAASRMSPNALSSSHPSLATDEGDDVDYVSTLPHQQSLESVPFKVSPFSQSPPRCDHILADNRLNSFPSRTASIRLHETLSTASTVRHSPPNVSGHDQSLLSSKPLNISSVSIMGNSPVRSTVALPNANSTPDSNQSKHDADEAESDTWNRDDDMPTPPDGGYGWVVVAASFVASMIADGSGFSFGIFFVELLDVFHQSRERTAWVGSVFISMPQICGPVASALTNRFGCRRTTIAGGLVAAIGFMTSAFVDSIEVLCLTFGIIAGFGLALVFVPGVVIVAFYFEKRRAFATALSVAGSGIGTFIFAPLTGKLIEMYSWRGALMVMSGIMLNIVVCGALFRPLPRKTKPRVPSRHHFVRRDSAIADDAEITYYEPVTQSVIQFPTYLKDEWAVLAPVLLEELRQRKTGVTLAEVMAARKLLDRFRVTVQPAPAGTGVGQQPLAADATKELVEPRENVVSVWTYTASNTALQAPSSTLPIPGAKKSSAAKQSLLRPSTNEVTQVPPNSASVRTTTAVASRPHGVTERRNERFVAVGRTDAFYRGSLIKARFMVDRLPTTRVHVNTDEYSASCPNLIVRGHQQQKQDTATPHPRSRWRRCVRSVVNVLRKNLDLSIFRSVIFDYFCLHSLLLFLIYDIPYVYVPDKAMRDGTDPAKASFLVSIIGVSSTVGQIAMGYIGDMPRVNTLYFYISMTSIAGMATIPVPILSSFGLLAGYSAVYGFFISANYALTTIILVDLLGMNRLTDAYGFMLLIQGIANLVGPPLAGWTFDVTNSYDTTFFMAGSIIWASGLMLLAVPCLKRCDPFSAKPQRPNNKRRNEKLNDKNPTPIPAAVSWSDPNVGLPTVQ